MLPLALFLLLLVVSVLCDAPVTIDGSDVYQNQRVCAFRCFKQFNDVGYPIAQAILCPTFPVKNDCFCRLDVQRDAHLYVSSCVSGGCSRNQLDISVATKLYDDYCTSNGYTQTATVTAPSDSGGSLSSSSKPSPAVTSPPTPDSPPTSQTSASLPPNATSSPPPNEVQGSGSASSGGDKLSGGELAGIIVGVISAVGTVIGVYFAWKTYKVKERSTTRTPEVRGLPAGRWN